MSGQSWVGRTIAGRYQINDLLGQGGMSAVYRAYDPNLRRNVAIKLIHTHLSTDPNFIGRFKEEAAAVARLRHPNIVQVHDFDIDDGTYYMVMEYLVGETLQDRLRRLNASQRKMPLPEAVQICAQLCKAVGYAHQHELVHRDIKPANIMLDVNNQPILMDFGIVKIIGGDYHTATGATIGTAMYMSPEQIRSERVDDRSDIYSLGVTLYEMISGKPPYLANSAMTIMMMVLNDPLPDLGEYRPEIPDDLLAAVHKALAKEPSERYQSMEELAAALTLTPDQPSTANLPDTIIDQDKIEPVVTPVSTSPLIEPTPDVDDINKSAVPPAITVEDQDHQQELNNNTLSSNQDLNTGLDRTQPQSVLHTTRSKIRLNSKRKSVGAIGLLIVLSIITVGFLYLNRNSPRIDLTPISQPGYPINAQTASYVVNLGRWEIGSHIEALTYSPDGSLLGTANNRDTLPIFQNHYYSSLWQTGTGSLKSYLYGHDQWVNDVAFSPDGQIFGSASDDGTVSLWQTDSGQRIRTIEASNGGFTCLDFSSNNLLLAAGSWDGVVSLWQVDNGNLLRTLTVNDYSIRDIAFSPDGQLLAGASEDNTILIWRVSDGNLVHTMSGHTDVIYSVAFSPDGNLLTSVSEDYSARLWQMDVGTLVKTLEGHTDSVFDVDFSRDGSLLATGSADGTIRLWLVDDGQLATTPIESSDTITSVEFSPDHQLLVSGSGEGFLLFWGISAAIPVESESRPDSP